MTVGPIPVNPASPLKPVAVKIAEYDGSWDEMMKKAKPLSEAEANKMLEEQGKLKIQAVFKVDGKIVAAQYQNGWSHIEQDTSLVMGAIDKAGATGGDASSRTTQIEAALRKQYGSRLSVSTMSTGLQMNENQLMAAIEKQRVSKW